MLARARRVPRRQARLLLLGRALVSGRMTASWMRRSCASDQEREDFLKRETELLDMLDDKVRLDACNSQFDC